MRFPLQDDAIRVGWNFMVLVRYLPFYCDIEDIRSCFHRRESRGAFSWYFLVETHGSEKQCFRNAKISIVCTNPSYLFLACSFHNKLYNSNYKTQLHSQNQFLTIIPSSCSTICSSKALCEVNSSLHCEHFSNMESCSTAMWAFKSAALMNLVSHTSQSCKLSTTSLCWLVRWRRRARTESKPISQSSHWWMESSMRSWFFKCCRRLDL